MNFRDLAGKTVSDAGQESLLSHQSCGNGTSCPVRQRCYEYRNDSAADVYWCSCDQLFGYTGSDCTSLSEHSYVAAILYIFLALSWILLTAGLLGNLLILSRVSNRVKRNNTAIYLICTMFLITSALAIVRNSYLASQSLGVASGFDSFIDDFLLLSEWSLLFLSINALGVSWLEIIARMETVPKPRESQILLFKRCLTLLILVALLSGAVSSLLRHSGVTYAMLIIAAFSTLGIYLLSAFYLAQFVTDDDLETHTVFPAYRNSSSNASNSLRSSATNDSNSSGKTQSPAKHSQNAAGLHDGTSVAGNAGGEDHQTAHSGTALVARDVRVLLRWSHALTMSDSIIRLDFSGIGIRRTALSIILWMGLTGLCDGLVTRYLNDGFSDMKLLFIGYVAGEICKLFIVAIGVVHVAGLCRYTIQQLLRHGHLVQKIKKHHTVLPSFDSINVPGD